MIKLIINADDFGYSRLFNKMILELIENNQITSTSVMIESIDEKQKEQVKKLISLSKKASIGLHVYFKNTNFREEIERQFREFVKVFGFKPHFIDLHKTTYIKDGYLVIQEFCKENNLPCKNFSNRCKKINGVMTTKELTFDGTYNSYDKIEKWLSSLKDDFYVIIFHPGYYDPESKSSLNKEREIDAENIKKMNSTLDKYNITLVNFKDLAAYFSKKN